MVHVERGSADDGADDENEWVYAAQNSEKASEHGQLNQDPRIASLSYIRAR